MATCGSTDGWGGPSHAPTGASSVVIKPRAIFALHSPRCGISAPWRWSTRWESLRVFLGVGGQRWLQRLRTLKPGEGGLKFPRAVEGSRGRKLCFLQEGQECQSYLGPSGQAPVILREFCLPEWGGPSRKRLQGLLPKSWVAWGW